MVMAAPIKDETGNRYGKLVVLRRATGEGRSRRSYWECLCDCGTMKVVFGDSLRQGCTSSCGCAHHAHLVTHGKTGTRVYRIWKAMQTRCFNRNTKVWPRYGGRGITVCDRWMKFENFYADMGDPPAGFSIERVDNNGNYNPSNCKWIPLGEQALNQSRTIKIDVGGEVLTITELSKVVGASCLALYKRILNTGSIYGAKPHTRAATEAAIARWKSLR